MDISKRCIGRDTRAGTARAQEIPWYLGKPRSPTTDRELSSKNYDFCCRTEEVARLPMPANKRLDQQEQMIWVH